MLSMLSSPVNGTARSAHINMLPPELLQHIFYCTKLVRLVRKRNQVYTEVAISHVCRSWRALALDSPRLWSLMYIKQTAWLTDHTILAEWFRRCKTVPMRVMVHIIDSDLWDDVRGCPDEALVEKAVAGFAFILTRIGQIRSFECNFGGNVVMCKHRFIKELMRAGDAPVLETLGLYFDNYDTMHSETVTAEDIELYSSPIFRGVHPRLKNLTLWGVPADPVTQNRMFKSLVRLEMGLLADNDRPSFDQLKTMLLCSSDLATLEINFSAPLRSSEWPRVLDREVITLTNLTTLALAGFDATELGQFLDLVCVPRLERLSLQLEAASADSGQPGSYDPVISKLGGMHPLYHRPYFSSLVFLHLEDIDCGPGPLRDLFNALGVLERLELELCPTNSTMIHVLAADQQQGKLPNLPAVLLPRLETLKLFRSEEEKVLVPDIESVLRTRYVAGCRLATLIVHRDMLPEDACVVATYVQALEFITDDGLDL